MEMQWSQISPNEVPDRCLERRPRRSGVPRRSGSTSLRRTPEDRASAIGPARGGCGEVTRLRPAKGLTVPVDRMTRLDSCGAPA